MPHTKTIRLEVTTEVIEGIALGDKITATVSGEVTSLEAERTFEGLGDGGEDTFPPEIVLELSSVKIRKPSQVDVLMEDDDDEEEIMGNG